MCGILCTKMHKINNLQKYIKASAYIIYLKPDTISSLLVN